MAPISTNSSTGFGRGLSKKSVDGQLYVVPLISNDAVPLPTQ